MVITVYQSMLLSCIFIYKKPHYSSCTESLVPEQYTFPTQSKSFICCHEDSAKQALLWIVPPFMKCTSGICESSIDLLWKKKKIHDQLLPITDLLWKKKKKSMVSNLVQFLTLTTLKFLQSIIKTRFTFAG